jgi:hypothetical protein
MLSKYRDTLMERISLKTFFSPETDWEMNQYRILGGLKELSMELDRKKIYPSLAQLIELKSSLEQIKAKRNSLDGKFPKQIKSFNITEKKITLETPALFNNQKNVEDVFDLINWALPIIQNTIDEGIVLFDFVEKNITLEQVGILPIYKEEGYFMITNNIAAELEVHRYECSLFLSGKEKFRALKTEFIRSEKQGFVRRPPESIKHDLLKERRDLPNPAAFICDTDLDFPFTETIFPVAKRKLITLLAA